MVMCFVLGVNLGEVEIVIKLLLSSQTVHLKTGFLGINPNVPEISFIRPIKGITSLIAVNKAIYSLSVVLRAISVCSLLPQVIGHSENIIRKSVLDSTDPGQT